jgi:anti-sigma regulatory factor (Ser/Thr protein kinase)
MAMTSFDARGDNLQWQLAVSDASGVSEARRRVAASAQRLEFGEVEAGRAAIVVVEAATNLVKHGGGGVIVVREVQGDARGLEIMALDRGSGIARIAESLRDGMSTTGTAGNGLGAISRQSLEFDIASHPGQGTAVWASVAADARAPRAARPVAWGAVCLPVTGETACGDAWSVAPHPTGARVVVADGLGHGVLAAKASQAAVDAIARTPGAGPAEAIGAADGALRSTRGAALAVADVDLQAGVVRFAGVGNIAALVLRAEVQRSLVSMNGTVGHSQYRTRQFQEPFPAGALLLLHSDGLTTRWRVDAYAGLLNREPAVVAGVLFRDHCRGRDDVTVLAIRAA